MADATDYRTMRIPLRHGSGAMPAAGFGTLIADPGLMRTATRAALDAGYRHLDCAERYRNEPDIGDVLQAYYAASGLSRQNIFITTKLWNTNHRPERVEAAFERSRERLKLDVLDLYLIHTPFAFEPGDNFDPRTNPATLSTVTGSRCKRHGARWKIWSEEAGLGRSAFPTLVSRSLDRSTKGRASNPQSYKSRSTRICRKPSFSPTAASGEWWF
jgi:hypothetical protein